MSDPYQAAETLDIQAVRDRLVNKGLNYFAIVVPGIVALSLWRAIEHGWHPVYWIHIGFAVVIILSTIIKKFLSYRIRIFILIIPWLLVGIVGLPSFGLMGAAPLVLICVAFMATSAFGPRAGLLFCGISVITIITTGIAVITGIHTFSFDLAAYATSPSAWAVNSMMFILWIPSIILALGVIYKTLITSLDTLRKNERNYREIFNASTEAIFILDPDTGSIIDVNDRMLSLYGFEKNEVIGSSVLVISSGIPPYNENTAQEKIQTALADGPQTFEWHSKKKTGDLFWVEVSLKASTIGDQNRILAAARDITDRKKTQEILAQSEKMLSLGGLAAGMAHEINSPLGGILQSESVLRNRLMESIPGNVRAAESAGTSIGAIQAYAKDRNILQMLESIRNSGTRAATIVSDMLNFARVGDSHYSKNNLIELIKQTVNIAGTEYNLKKKYDFKEIQIVYDCDSNIPPIPCNGGKIQQVIFNILRNGAEAMQEAHENAQNSKFIIRIKNEEDIQMIRIEIADNGPGMPEGIRKHVFDPFFTTKSANKGTGLGLSVSYFIITEDHNGEIHVESEPGKGTTFIIRLPTNRNK